MISVGESMALVPVIYRGPVEITLTINLHLSSKDYGFLFIGGKPDDLAELFGQLASADGILHRSDGCRIKFRLYGRNSYNAARDPTLVICIKLLETLSDK